MQFIKLSYTDGHKCIVLFFSLVSIALLLWHDARLSQWSTDLQFGWRNFSWRWSRLYRHMKVLPKVGERDSYGNHAIFWTYASSDKTVTNSLKVPAEGSFFDILSHEGLHFYLPHNLAFNWYSRNALTTSNDFHVKSEERWAAEVH